MRKSHFTLVPERGAGSAELKIGLRSAPYLADHRLHGMVVLPGSFYIAAAAVLIARSSLLQPRSSRT